MQIVDRIDRLILYLEDDIPLLKFGIRRRRTGLDLIHHAPRETGVSYDVSHHDDRFFIVTNADGAVDFKIVARFPLGGA